MYRNREWALELNTPNPKYLKSKMFQTIRSCWYSESFRGTELISFRSSFQGSSVSASQLLQGETTLVIKKGKLPLGWECGNTLTRCRTWKTDWFFFPRPFSKTQLWEGSLTKHKLVLALGFESRPRNSSRHDTEEDRSLHLWSDRRPGHSCPSHITSPENLTSSFG